jgi:hypothetical protein
MPIKIFAATVAVVLVIGYLGAIVFKMKDAALTVIVLIGIAMMLSDLWQSQQREDE